MTWKLGKVINFTTKGEGPEAKPRYSVCFGPGLRLEQEDSRWQAGDQ